MGHEALGPPDTSSQLVYGLIHLPELVAGEDGDMRVPEPHRERVRQVWRPEDERPHSPDLVAEEGHPIRGRHQRDVASVLVDDGVVGHFGSPAPGPRAVGLKG